MSDDRLSLHVVAFTPHYKSTLRGFVSIVIEEWRLRINDLSVHESSRSRWVGMPARPMLDAGGELIRDHRGKIAYAPTLSFTSPTTRDSFSRRVIEELLVFAPAAFEMEEV